MNLVFMNTLERQAGEDRVRNAQISISEEKGMWYVFWTETLDDGMTVRDCLFEGYSWEQMLDRFRRHVHGKINEGFTPLVKDVWGAISKSNNAYHQSILKYYSESNKNEELYESLRKWRKDRSAKDAKSLFIVATNAMLNMISAFIPQSLEELKQIPGWTKRKVELYADEILNMTAGIERETSFPLDWVSSQIDMADFVHWNEKEIQQKEHAEQEKHENKIKLLNSIQEGERLTDLQKKLSLQRKELLSLVEELDKDGYDVIPLVDSELSLISQEQISTAWQAFAQEGDRFLKPVLSKVYDQDNLSNKDLNRAYEWLRLLRLKFRKEKQLLAI